MNLKIINNIDKKTIEFKYKNIKMYLCGPTVYNDIHIGNARPIITMDVLNRLLHVLKYNVFFLHNITDIDDKIILKADENNISEKEVSKFYYQEYIKILKKINIKLDFNIQKVTTNIKGITKYIEKILKKKYAYLLENGDIYFDTSKIKDYGKLSGQNLNEITNFSRIKENDFKKNPNDFVLWKKTNIGVNWNSPWSLGRPGWHTECSYLIDKFLGKKIDIHAGGIDLKFPHHENENAQNIAINNIEISKSWIHVGHVTINNEKMSKSLNNFYLMKDILRDFNSNHIRWFFYQTTYANPINFSLEIIEKSKKDIEDILNNLNIIKSYLIINNRYKEIKNIKNEFISDLINNLNFPNQISKILKTITKLNGLLKIKITSEVNFDYFNIINCLIIMGIKITNIHNEKNIKILLEWNKQKKLNNFKVSDKLRQKLIGIKLL